jgi:hypothetical protein
MTQASPARRAASRSDRPGPPGPAGRYGLLLLLLIATYLLGAFTRDRLIDNLQVAFFLAVLLLAVRTASVNRRTALTGGTIALLGSAAAIAAAWTHTGAGEGAADIWKGMMLLLTAVLIVRRVLAKRTVTVQSIFGAISAYMIIGLMFAAFYAAIWRLGGGSFFAGQQTAEHQTSTQTIQYFSFTTLTTLGYGDFTAASDGGRAVAVIEALIGQVFLATLVARLVASFRAPAEQASRTVSRPRPPKAVRRGPVISYRRKPAGNARRPSAKAPSAQVPQHTGVDDRALGPIE